MNSKAHLYVNSKGFEVRSHSYSGSDTFHFCPQKYKLSRLDGWQERGTNAARFFGIVLENAIRFYHESGKNLDHAIGSFEREWESVKKLQEETFEFSNESKEFLKKAGVKGLQAGDEIKYTKTEGSWEDLMDSGREMLKLYHLRLPLFPIDTTNSPRFQVKFYKEMFPNTEWAGVEFVAYIDMLARCKNSLGGQTGVDIKTSSAPLPNLPNILSLDQQLRTYAWVTGYPDWAFLQFQKTGRELERGTEVTVLEDVDFFKAGHTAVVIKFQEAAAGKEKDPFNSRSKAKEALSEETWIVANQKLIDDMFTECGDGQTKEEKEARDLYIKTHGTKVDKKTLTRQRVTFQTAHIPLSDQLEAAKQIGKDVAAIIHANEENFWPKLGGVRWPNDKCTHCSMRGICLQNEGIRDTLVYRSNEDFDVPERD